MYTYRQNKKGADKMPYIAIKAYPKNEETKKKLVDRINEAVLEIWGCPQDAITVSMESIEPERWEEVVVKPEIEPHIEKMMILSGQKKY